MGHSLFSPLGTCYWPRSQLLNFHLTYSGYCTQDLFHYNGLHEFYFCLLIFFLVWRLWWMAVLLMILKNSEFDHMRDDTTLANREVKVITGLCELIHDSEIQEFRCKPVWQDLCNPKP